ncbi:MAG: 50S ribosomal protein L9 [Chitinophagales bacterium]|jgi:large subunit ribosomal protein L9|nr:50S ribosomal protein L9 [Chitinophagales bacterium]
MEVILLKTIDKVGFKDEVINVKPGFARNYLIPKGYAMSSNPSNLKVLAERQKRNDKIEAKLLENINDLKAKLSALNIEIPVKVGQNNKIFGSVQVTQIAHIFHANNIEIDRKKISIKEGDVKELGAYTALVTLNKDTQIEVPFKVTAASAS